MHLSKVQSFCQWPVPSLCPQPVQSLCHQDTSRSPSRSAGPAEQGCCRSPLHRESSRRTCCSPDRAPVVTSCYTKNLWGLSQLLGLTNSDSTWWQQVWCDCYTFHKFRFLRWFLLLFCWKTQASCLAGVRWGTVWHGAMAVRGSVFMLIRVCSIPPLPVWKDYQPRFLLRRVVNGSSVPLSCTDLRDGLLTRP